MGLQSNSLKKKKKKRRTHCSVNPSCGPRREQISDLVSVHELLADDILTDARRRHQVVKLVEKLYTALMMLRCSFAQLLPQDQSHTLWETWIKTVCRPLKHSELSIVSNDVRLP